MKINRKYGEIDKSGQLVIYIEVDGFRGAAHLGCGWVLVPFFALLILKIVGLGSLTWGWVMFPLFAIPVAFFTWFMLNALYRVFRAWLRRRKAVDPRKDVRLQ